MQMAMIRYRVADFMKQNPPFHAMETEELMELASGGRVKFHESDEFIYWEGNAPNPFVYVIQQGTVRLVQGEEEAEKLVDIRGPGDLVGIDGVVGHSKYAHSAKTASDVILYAMPAKGFAELVERYPKARKFLDSHHTVDSAYSPVEASRPAAEVAVFELVKGREPQVCETGAMVREAAALLYQSGAESVAVMGPDGLAGAVTPRTLAGWLAQDGLGAGAKVEEAMAAVVCLKPETSVAECVLELSRRGAVVGAITNDGTNTGTLQALVTPGELQSAFGDQPAAILDRIRHARSTAELSGLNQRARQLLLSLLGDASAAGWLGRLAARFDDEIVERVIKLAGAGGEGQCWFVYGAAGRSENIAGVMPLVALIGDQAVKYNEVVAALGECGFMTNDDACLSAEEGCASLEEWKQRFAGWVREPVFRQMYRYRPLFDARAAHGDAELMRKLNRFVEEEISKDELFLGVLALDSLSNLPPITFFRGLVVEEGGGHSEMLDLERNLLRPIVDAARTLAIGPGVSTWERLQAARRAMPEQGEVLRQAEATLSVALYHQARTGIREGSAGARLQPSTLSRFDQHVLKSGFRGVLRLLELTAQRHGMEGP